MRSAVERDEFLTKQLKHNGHDRPFGRWRSFTIARRGNDFRGLEDRDIKVHGIFGLAVEPQEWGDFLHGILLSWWWKASAIDPSAFFSLNSPQSALSRACARGRRKAARRPGSGWCLCWCRTFSAP